jgi:hypothetical protein
MMTNDKGEQNILVNALSFGEITKNGNLYPSHLVHHFVAADPDGLKPAASSDAVLGYVQPERSTVEPPISFHTITTDKTADVPASFPRLKGLNDRAIGLIEDARTDRSVFDTMVTQFSNLRISEMTEEQIRAQFVGCTVISPQGDKLGAIKDISRGDSGQLLFVVEYIKLQPRLIRGEVKPVEIDNNQMVVQSIW